MEIDLKRELYAQISNAWRPVVKSLSDLAGLLTDEQAAAIHDLQVELERVVFGET